SPSFSGVRASAVTSCRRFRASSTTSRPTPPLGPSTTIRMSNPALAELSGSRFVRHHDGAPLQPAGAQTVVRLLNLLQRESFDMRTDASRACQSKHLRQFRTRAPERHGHAYFEWKRSKSDRQ